MFLKIGIFAPAILVTLECLIHFTSPQKLLCMIFSSNSIRILRLTVGHFQCYTLPFIKIFLYLSRSWSPNGCSTMFAIFVCMFYFVLFFSQVTQARPDCLELLAVCPNPPSIIYFLINHFRLYRLNNDILCKEERL